MATPNRRPTERTPGFTTRKGDFVPLPPLDPNTRTRRDLEADPRVKSMQFADGKVTIRLNDRWSFSDCGPVRIMTFDLWERARNAVRRAEGPSLRDLKKEQAAGHLDKDAC